MKILQAISAAILLLPYAASATSVYTHRLEDKAAAYLDRDSYGAVGDGKADDTVAIQRAINHVEETTKQGIVFIPEGRYRLSATLYVWPGIRLIGYGAHRPVFLLGDNAPGYQEKIGYMVFFTGARPNDQTRRRNVASSSKPAESFPGTVPPSADVIDANPGTFYSALSNVDFEMGQGNPAAVGIRFHVAQHCLLTHMGFHIDSGLAALHDIGNEAEDLHFYGGRFGIMTVKP